jgi:hypothetical protein
MLVLMGSNCLCKQPPSAPKLGTWLQSAELTSLLLLLLLLPLLLLLLLLLLGAGACADGSLCRRPC